MIDMLFTSEPVFWIAAAGVVVCLVGAAALMFAQLGRWACGYRLIDRPRSTLLRR